VLGPEQFLNGWPTEKFYRVCISEDKNAQKRLGLICGASLWSYIAVRSNDHQARSGGGVTLSVIPRLIGPTNRLSRTPLRPHAHATKPPDSDQATRVPRPKCVRAFARAASHPCASRPSPEPPSTPPARGSHSKEWPTGILRLTEEFYKMDEHCTKMTDSMSENGWQSDKMIEHCSKMTAHCSKWLSSL
jgi:hypothetical protein